MANMIKEIGIGVQDFSQLRQNNNFYIDKTSFIKEWWDSGDSVTLITRPRRFGKTLNMSMVEQFFSVDYANRGDLFEGLAIWEYEEYRQLLSYFDTGLHASKAQPERFYHGFALGLLVDLKGRFVVTSNRESGFGRYDIMLEPVNRDRDDAIIIEFKVFNPRKEKTLEDTLAVALAQIEEKQYEAELIGKGFKLEKIRKYGFAFEGKKVLIG